MAPKKSRFVRYIGSFSPQPMISFISGVLRGSIPTAPLASSPLTFDTDPDIEICLSQTDAIPQFIDDSEDDEDFYAMMAEIREEEELAKKERRVRKKKIQKKRRKQK